MGECASYGAYEHTGAWNNLQRQTSQSKAGERDYKILAVVRLKTMDVLASSIASSFLPDTMKASISSVICYRVYHQSHRWICR